MSQVLCSASLVTIGAARVLLSPSGHRLTAFVYATELGVATFSCGRFHFIPILLLIAVQPTTRFIASTWVTRAEKYIALPKWVPAGPLGNGCYKVIEVMVASLAWKLGRGRIPFSLLPRASQLTSNVVFFYTVALVCCSVSVNIVLGAWSKLSRSRGSHKGLEKYTKQLSSKPVLRDEIELLFLAAVNAFCEESTSRGFWRQEFMETSGLSSLQANIAQSLLFGAWHFHGVPNGWSGVGLTFCYGLLMGLLADWSGGALLLPILAHTIADYYIFSVILRRKQ